MDGGLIPLVHYNYDLLEDCQCAVCQQFRTAQADYVQNMALRRHHRRNCSCVFCRKRVPLRMAYEAAMCRREVFSEGTFVLEGVSPARIEGLFLAVLADTHSARWWAKTTQAWTIWGWITYFERTDNRDGLSEPSLESPPLPP